MKTQIKISHYLLMSVAFFVLLLLAQSIKAEATTPTIEIAVGEKISTDSIITALDINEELDTLSVSLIVSDKTIASASGGKVITGLAKGDTLVTVMVKDTSYSTSFMLKVIPTVTEVKLDKQSDEIYIGEKLQLKETVFPSTAINKEVTWRTSDKDVATVSKGLVIGQSKGEAVITATTKDGNFIAFCIVKVQPMVTGLIVETPQITVGVGESTLIGGTIVPENSFERTIWFTNTNKAVATVSKVGMITGLKEGTTTIILETKDGGFQGIVNVTVVSDINILYLCNKENVAVNQIDINVGEKTKLTPLVGKQTPPADFKDCSKYKITWVSTDKSVATVSSSGEIKGISDGIAVIYATTTQDIDNLQASVFVKVSTTATGVTLNKSLLNLRVGKSETLFANVLPATAKIKDITWKSSDKTVATVLKGKVKAISSGTSFITATTADGGFIATCEVRVGTTVEIDNCPKSNVVLYMGDVYSFTPTLTPVTGKEVADDGTTFVASDKKCIRIGKTDDKFKITALKPGMSTITITTKDGKKVATVNVTVLSRTLSIKVYDKNGNMVNKNQ